MTEGGNNLLIVSCSNCATGYGIIFQERAKVNFAEH